MKYAKAWAAIAGAALTAAQTALDLTPEQRGWVTIAIAFVTAVTVYAVPNAPAAAGLPKPPPLDY
jgi:hypothetical protein